MVLAVALGFSGAAAAFDEGIDYKRLEQPLSTIDHNREVQVTEIFWYGCPHCYRVREPFGVWADGLADDVRVEHLPVVFNRRVEPHARAYYAAELLGIKDEVHPAIFEAIHDEGRDLSSPRAIAEFFTDYGIEADKAEQTLDSFGVATKLRRARSVTRRAGIEGVPSFVVAGEYVTSLSLHGDTERLFEVLDYLVDKVRSERAE
jgi:thiol:disulfide interchange protein DsbA